MSKCLELAGVLEREPFFDCIGGCGVDLSMGNDPCMNSSGIWFKFCPFCGKKIVRQKVMDGNTFVKWDWYEAKEEE